MKETRTTRLELQQAYAKFSNSITNERRPESSCYFEAKRRSYTQFVVCGHSIEIRKNRNSPLPDPRRMGTRDARCVTDSNFGCGLKTYSGF